VAGAAVARLGSQFHLGLDPEIAESTTTGLSGGAAKPPFLLRVRLLTLLDRDQAGVKKVFAAK
jgi:hypothetical protein